MSEHSFKVGDLVVLNPDCHDQYQHVFAGHFGSGPRVIKLVVGGFLVFEGVHGWGWSSKRVVPYKVKRPKLTTKFTKWVALTEQKKCDTLIT